MNVSLYFRLEDSSHMKGRIGYIDIAKGLAILFVLLMHRWAVPVGGRIIGSFYMPLFFFTSGFTAKNMRGGGTGSTVKRNADLFC